VKPLSTESLRGLLLTAKYGPAALM
jgi:hypothetical protein